MSEICRRAAGSGWFQNAVIAVIVVNAAIIGLETSHTLVTSHGRLFGSLNVAVQALFVLEIGVRLGAYWPQVSRFFRDGWNVFDFAVVGASLLPAIGPFATVARLARILRVGRLLSSFPELRLIVGTMLRSIPSMGNVILLLALLMYVYGVLGYSLSHAHDPQHWGSLGASVRTLFQITTLEGWVEIQAVLLGVYPWAWVYFASFIVIAVFVVINLFVAVVINNLEAAKKELEASSDAQNASAGLLRRIESIKEDLSELERELRRDARAAAGYKVQS